jgi:hypothetical protein
MTDMDVNLPDVVQEVQAVFDSYEKALTENDTARLAVLFWDSPLTLRYGEKENLYSAVEIEAFRASRPPGPRPRELLGVRITTFGTDFAVANAEFRNRNETRLGRQSQSWARIGGRWRIVSAHVSYMQA